MNTDKNGKQLRYGDLVYASMSYPGTDWEPFIAKIIEGNNRDLYSAIVLHSGVGCLLRIGEIELLPTDEKEKESFLFLKKLER